MQGHKRRHREQLDLPLSDKGRNGRRTLDPEIRREIVRHRPRRCSASRNARTPPSDDNSPPSNLATTALPSTGDKPASGNIGLVMAGVASLKSRESASTTRFYTKSDIYATSASPR